MTVHAWGWLVLVGTHTQRQCRWRRGGGRDAGIACL